MTASRKSATGRTFRLAPALHMTAPVRHHSRLHRIESLTRLDWLLVAAILLVLAAILLTPAQ